MNIDIVNKQVAVKFNMRESEVAQINKFFWQQIREHLYSYTPLPVNIPNVCVLYPTAYHTRKQILFYIAAIRKLIVSRRYKPDSIIRQQRIETYKQTIRKIWAIRKQNKFI